jgi:hypothetical protein
LPTSEAQSENLARFASQEAQLRSPGATTSTVPPGSS